MLPVLLKGGVWRLYIMGETFNLRLLLPMYVFVDALEAAADLCAFILPLFGLPNYAAMLCELCMGIDLPAGDKLFQVESDGVRVSLQR